MVMTSNAGTKKVEVPLPRTEGLTDLDKDRAASVADEGGSSAATVEVQRPAPAEKSAPKVRDAETADANGRK